MTSIGHLIEQEQNVCAQNYAPLPVVLVRGEGVWVWDSENKKYLDMMSAYSAVSHGHVHPKILEALSAQAKKLGVISRAFHSETLTPFLAKLCVISGMERALPMNTGAEAVETAIKAARRYGYQHKNIPKDKAEIIVCRNNFHGRTVTLISFSSEAEYKKEFGPFTPGFIEIPFGDAKALEKAITPNTCAFLVEPIQGEAGIRMPHAGYLKEVEKICHAKQVLLIVDEVQSGLGRTGQWFAFMHENVKPDGIIVGKALGGGMLPVSAFLAKQAVMDVFKPGSHGSTFGGNPLACAVGLKALQVIEEEGLRENSAVLGEYFLTRLSAIKSKLIKEVRGKGLWIGVEIDTNRKPAREVCMELLKEGILSKDVHDTVIRFAPPLIIDKKTLDWGLEKIDRVFCRVGKA